MSLSFRLRHPRGRTTLQNIDASMPLAAFKTRVEELSGVAADLQEFLAGSFPPSSAAIIMADCVDCHVGYPPTVMTIPSDACNLTQAGFQNGDTVIVKAKQTPATVTGQGATLPAATVSDAHASQSTSTSTSPSPCLVRRVVAADNSCLFRSILYLLDPVTIVNGLLPENIPADKIHALRQSVAEYILQHGDEFNEAVLGKSPERYSEWIMTPDAWGGMTRVRFEPFVTSVMPFDHALRACLVDMWQ